MPSSEMGSCGSPDPTPWPYHFLLTVLLHMRDIGFATSRVATLAAGLHVLAFRIMALFDKSNTRRRDGHLGAWSKTT